MLQQKSVMRNKFNGIIKINLIYTTSRFWLPEVGVN